MPFIAPLIEVGIAAFATVSTFVAATGIIGQGIIAIGLGVASSFLINKLMPKPDAGSDLPGGVQFQRQYGNDVPRQVACGLVGIAGHDTYVNTFMPSNQVLQQIYTLSDFYTTALSRVAINGAYVALGTDTTGLGQPVTSGGDFVNLIWIKFLDGRQTAAEDHLIANANPSDRWSANNIGVGVSAVIVTMQFDKDKNNSFPDFFFEFQGAPLYDWRKDSTNGGSGTHRFSDPLTWTYSENPMLMAYNYRRGFSIAGDLFCGMGMPASDLPVDKWTPAAAVCDELDTSDGLPRYRASVLLDCTATHSDNLQALSISCGSMDIDSVDGSWPLVGTAQSVVATITDDDIIRTADNYRYSERQSMGTLVNSVSGNYPEPDQLWSMIGYNPQLSPTLVTVDRRTRDTNIDFPMVPSARQCSDLAAIYFAENRFEATATITLRPRYRVLEPGDWITWVSRYGTKTFIITNKQLISLDNVDGPRNVVLTLQERDSSIYTGVTTPDVFIPVPNPGPVLMSELLSFAIFAVSVQGVTGRAQPAIRVSWLPPDDLTVVQVELMYYPTAQGTTNAVNKIVSADNSVVTLADGIVGKTNYTVQARIITNPVRTTVFNAGATVTTLDISLGIGDLDQSIQDELTIIAAQNSARISALEDLIANSVANQDSGNWIDKSLVRSQMIALSNEASAEIDEVRQVAVDTNTAFASFQTEVSATFGPNFSTVSTVSDAIATIDGMTASRYAINLNSNGHAIGFELIDGSGGFGSATFVVDQFQISLPPANGGAPFSVFTIGTVGTSVKVGINADDVIINGTITARMMNVGTLSAISANIGSVTAGTMQSADGKFLIDLNNKRLTISD